jgi:hypothetical protein
MPEEMTKARLLELLQTKRAEWDATLAQVPKDRMTEPGVAGEWSVRAIVAHINYHERWYADRLHEQLRGETYRPNEIDMIHFDERNGIVYEQNRHRTPSDVVAESRQVFQRLLEGVQAQSEEFLTRPQRFEGAPGPVLIWNMLHGDVYEHYALHIPSIKEWLSGESA